MDIAKLDTHPPGDTPSANRAPDAAARVVETRPQLLEAASSPVFPPVLPVSASELASALETANAWVQAQSAAIEFSLDQESGRTVIRMVDSETEEVLRQFPSEDLLAISRSIEKMRGLLIDAKA